MSETQANIRAAIIVRLPDAAAPLYATLDEGQRRRAAMLARPMGHGFRHDFGGRRNGPEGRRDRDDD